MKRNKLLVPAYSIRRLAIGKLRETLSALQEMSDAGGVTPQVYDTYVAVAKEVERRGLKATAKPETLVARGAVYVMRVGDIREKIADLLQEEQTEVVRNTVSLLSSELGRRAMLAKRTYKQRRSAANAFMEGTRA